jgi:preprotein translocase subunit SecE
MEIKNPSFKIISFLKEVKTEIRKINWPTREETLKYVLVVIGISLIVSVYLGGLDILLKFLLEKFILK